MNSFSHAYRPALQISRVVSLDVKAPLMFPRHQHCDYEFIYLWAGDYEYRHNDFSSRLASGHGLLVRPGDWHIDYLSPGTCYTAVNFIVPDEAFSLRRDDAPEALLVVADQSQELGRIVAKLREENRADDVSASHLCEAHIHELYWQLVRRLPPDAVPSRLRQERGGDAERLMSELRRVAMQHVQQNITLADLSRQLRLSPRSLNNHCRTLLGMSPIQACCRIKMDYARELLDNTDMSIKEISEYLGFRNPYHFSAAFKRIFQVSPRFSRRRG